MNNLDNIYWKTYGWFSTDLKLKGIEKEVFAIVYSYTSADKNCFLSIKDFAYLTGSSRRSIINALEQLVKKDLLIKTEMDNTKWESNVYDVNIESVNKIRDTLVKKLHHPSEKIAPYIYNNINDIISNKDTILDYNKVKECRFSQNDHMNYEFWKANVFYNQIVSICHRVNDSSCFTNLMLNILPLFEGYSRLYSKQKRIIGNDAMYKAVKAINEFIECEFDGDASNLEYDFEEMMHYFFSVKSVDKDDTLSLTQFANYNMLKGCYNSTVYEWNFESSKFI